MTPPTLRTREDGTVWLEDRMPDVLSISYQLLEQSNPRVMEVRGDFVDIRLANGRWVYEIAERDDARAVAVCRIRYREDPT